MLSSSQQEKADQYEIVMIQADLRLPSEHFEHWLLKLQMNLMLVGTLLKYQREVVLAELYEV